MNPILTDGSKLFNDLLMQLGSFECQLKVGLTYSKQLMGTSATDLSQKYQSGFPGAAFPKLLLLLMAQKTATCLTDTYIMEKRGQWAMARGPHGIFGCLMEEFIPKMQEYLLKPENRILFTKESLVIDPSMFKALDYMIRK